MAICYIETPLGCAQITGNSDGITSVSIQNDSCKISDTIPKILIACVTQLNAYFDKKRNTFDLKLNPKGTDFQQKVWRHLQTVPYGKTMSYRHLSLQISDVKAIRAVANANGKNPLWILIPCHRIIGSDGSLTGYAGGLHRKKWLLEHEIGFKQHTLF